MITVSEVFGPTVQGEGPFTGQRCSFIRLGACNLTCSWCDTPYTWDAKRYNLRDELSNESVETILLQLPPTPGIVVISGGEPLLQQDKPEWPTLLAKVNEVASGIHVETNGTIAPNPATHTRVTHFSVSPKPPSANTNGAIPGAVMNVWRHLWETHSVIFKFVAATDADLDWIDTYVTTQNIPRNLVWVMPEGITRDTHLVNLAKHADHIVELGYNLTTRLHTLAWNTERNH